MSRLSKERKVENQKSMHKLHLQNMINTSLYLLIDVDSLKQIRLKNTELEKKQLLTICRLAHLTTTGAISLPNNLPHH